MQRIKKSIALAITQAMVIISLAACGGGDGGNHGDTGTGQAASTDEPIAADGLAKIQAVSSTLTVRARADLAGTVAGPATSKQGAFMVIMSNGKVLGTTEVKSTGYIDYAFPISSETPITLLDVVYNNDLNTAAGQDRNLFVQSITLNGRTLQPTDPGVTFDRATADPATAFDGLDVLPGTVSLWWNGALRFPITAAATTGAPYLAFSDLVSGPRLGNSDNSQAGQVAGTDGAIVTLWGKNLGSGANSTIKVGGVPARVYYWGPASHGGGANLSGRQGMQMIEFQVPRTAPLGATEVAVSVNGVTSNTLPFTTRDTGRIYFIGTGGAANDNNPGTYASPWANYFPKALDATQPGDIIYLLNGFTVSTEARVTGGSMMPLAKSGSAANPRAVIAYPGATATIGGTQCATDGGSLIRSFNPAGDAPISDWVVSKLRLVSPGDCVQNMAIEASTGYRVIANYMSTPRTHNGCQVGTLQCGGGGACGDNIAVLGNELTGIQTVNKLEGSKQCHGIYMSGDRYTARLESNREIAWNYIHDNSNNRAINIYNEPSNGAANQAFITGHKVHDNWIENQSGIGILMGGNVVGQNWLYNNVIVNAGLAPDQAGTTHGIGAGSVFADSIGNYFPLQIGIGSTYTTAHAASNTARDSTVLHAYNNLVYGRSNSRLLNTNASYAVGLMEYGPQAPNGSLLIPTLNFYNNIMVSTASGVPYLASSSIQPKGKNNLWFGAGLAPAGETAAINPASATDLFVNAAGGNFRLKTTGAANPARNAGTAVPSVTRDFDGGARQQGTAVDVGPYEAP